MRRKYQRWSLPTALLVGSLVVFVCLFFAVNRFGGADNVEAPIVSQPYGQATELAAALFADPALVDDVKVSSPDASSTVDVAAATGGAESGDRLLISSGSIATPDGSADPAGEALLQIPDSLRGGAFDVTVVEVRFSVPDGSSCLEIPHLQFGSDEQADVADPLAEGFVLELDRSAWTAQRGESSRPAERVRLHAAPETGLSQKFAADLGVALATPQLRVAIPIEPGLHTLYLSIYDTKDAAGDSLVAIGGLRLSAATKDEACDGAVKLSNGTNLVALGDSNAAGFGVPPFETGTAEATGNNCQRSTKSYPALVAELAEYDLVSAACSGATTEHLYTANEAKGEPAQLDSVKPDTGVVVLTVGANDAAWLNEIRSCVLESILGPPCNESATINEKFDAVLGRLAGKSSEPARIYPYEEIFAEVSRRAPYAHIVVVTYPRLFPAEGGNDSAGFFGSNRCVSLLKSDQRWLNKRMSELVETVTSAAAGTQISVIDPSAQFAGHALCETPSWFMDLSDPGPLHPNEAGHKAIAKLIYEHISARG